MRRLGRLFFIMLILGGLAMPTLQSAAAQADPTPAAESGVNGNSYTSPTFGYSITWDNTWNVTDEASETGYDRVVLDNGDATVYLEGFQDSTALSDCIDTVVASLEKTDGVSDVKPAKDQNGDVLAGSESGREWAVYDLTYTGSGGNAVDLSEYFDCRPIVEGESLLVITMVAQKSKFDDQVDPLLALLDNLEIGDGTGSTNTPSNQTETTPEAGTTVTEDDLKGWVELSAKDIDAFWEREFPRISGGKQYTPPAGIVAHDSSVDTACGTVTTENNLAAYCPPDQTVYYNLAFANLQIQTFGSASVIAVVLAHEIGHHIQNLMAWKECEKTPCLDPTELTSQEFELQADCFAGAWIADAETRGRMGSLDIETNISQYAQWLGGGQNTADPGEHGKGASRVYWLLSGYFFGVERCLTVSAATDPARGATTSNNGGDNGNATTPEPTEEATAEPTEEATAEPTEEASPEAAAIGDEITVELSDETLTMTVTGTEFSDTVEGVSPQGRFLIVYATVSREADAPGPMRYRSFIVTDGDGNVYRLDSDATDALLKTAFKDGIDENLDLGASYNVALVFDVDAGASGFTLSTSQGDNPVTLDA